MSGYKHPATRAAPALVVFSLNAFLEAWRMSTDIPEIKFSDLMRLVYAFMRIKDPDKRERLLVLAEKHVQKIADEGE